MSRMNHHTKKIVRELRLEIVHLRTHNAELEAAAWQSDFDAQDARSRAEQESWNAHQDLERARRASEEARESERRAENRHYEVQTATRELERAQDWQCITGSRAADWAVERAIDRLKRI